MSSAAATFWQSMDRHHDLAEQFERNIETAHPDIVTSEGMCPCLEYTSWCDWAVTSVVYHEYRGPSI